MAKFTKKQIEAAAKAAWDANKAHCDAIGEAQPTWEEAPKILKESVLSGVRSVIENPEMTPEASHEKWMAYKAAEGWVYGETKDVDAKTHPCMVPYAELPEAQRVKDDIFQKAVRGVLWPAPSPWAIGDRVVVTINGTEHEGVIDAIKEAEHDGEFSTIDAEVTPSMTHVTGKNLAMNVPHEDVAGEGAPLKWRLAD